MLQGQLPKGLALGGPSSHPHGSASSWVAWKIQEAFFRLLAKLESSFGVNVVVTLPFGCFFFWGGGVDFGEKHVRNFFVALWSEPGPGSARIGFLAKNYA